MKDILFLKHEPLLEKFREMRAYEKKVKKAVSKKNKDLAERLLTRKPSYTLDMLIRERLVLLPNFNTCFCCIVNYHDFNIGTLCMALDTQNLLIH